MKKYISNLIFVIANITMVILSCIFLKDMEKIIKIGAVLIFLMLCIAIPSINNPTVYKLLITVSAFLGIIMLIFIILSSLNLMYIFKDFDLIKNFILNTKQWGVFVFLAITILQVVVLPIPSAVTILIGVAIYGPLWSFILSTIGTYIGSVISFYGGRTFGKKLVCWLFGEEKTLKYASYLNQKGKGMFIIMLLFPLFPDDLICMVAGISTMSTKFFLISMMLTRPIMIALTAFLGSGKIIPFKGWGIPVWIALLGAAIVAFFVINHIKNKISKRRAKKDSNPITK